MGVKVLNFNKHFLAAQVSKKIVRNSMNQYFTVSFVSFTFESMRSFKKLVTIPHRNGDYSFSKYR